MATEINFTIGNPDAHEKFKKDHFDFIQGFPLLTEAIRKAFSLRYDGNDLIDALVFDLGEKCVNRFSEIGFLCANGMEEGAFITLRSMFEYLVTAKYLHLYPEKSDDFVYYAFVQLRTGYNQMERLSKGENYSKDFREHKKSVEKNFDKVKERFTYPVKNGRMKTKSSWSDLGFVDMAMKSNLGDFIMPAYYRPIEVAHPSVLHLASGLDEKDPPSFPLLVSHRLIIELLALQSEHFKIDGLVPLIEQCYQDFYNIWEKYKP